MEVLKAGEAEEFTAETSTGRRRGRRGDAEGRLVARVRVRTV